MHEPLLARAAFPIQWRVLGVPLRPYSLGHELCLIRHGSPFLSGGEPTRADVLSAVLICASTWRELQGTDPLLGLKSRFIAWNARKESTEAAIAQFRAYRADAWQELPCIPEPLEAGEKAPRAPGAPFLLRLCQFLILRLGLSESAAWDYPLAMALMHWQAYGEAERALRVKNEADVFMEEYVAKMDAQEAEEKRCQA